MPARLHTFVRDEVLPSYWANRIQDALAGQARVRLERQDATHVRAVAGADDAASVLNIGGLWRLNEANAVVAHPGGAAADFAIFATAKAQNVVNAPAPNTDNTDYTWALAITAIGATPPIVAGVVDVFRRVGRLHWDGAAITAVWQEVAPITGAMIEDAAITPGQVAMTRQPDGSIKFDIVDGSILNADIANGQITDAKVSVGAAIAPAKIAGTAVVNADARLADTRVPTDGSVTDVKVAAGAAIAPAKIAGTAVVTGDARLADQRVPLANSVDSSKIVDGSVANADLAGAISMSKLSARIRGEVIPGIAGGVVTWGAPINYNAGSGAINPFTDTANKITAPVDGVYLITVNLFLAAGDANRLLRLRDAAGKTIAGGWGAIDNGGYNTAMGLVWMGFLAAGALLDLQMMQPAAPLDDATHKSRIALVQLSA